MILVFICKEQGRHEPCKGFITVRGGGEEEGGHNSLIGSNKGRMHVSIHSNVSAFFLHHCTFILSSPRHPISASPPDHTLRLPPLLHSG